MQRAEQHEMTDYDFEQLVIRCQTPLLRMCCLHLRDAALAEDAVQETFLKAYRSRNTFRYESSEKTWLMRIAINTCRDMLRGKWFKYVCRNVPLELLPDERFTLSEESVAVNMAIAALPQKLREAVLLYYYQGFTLEETAETLGIASSSASGRLKRAKEKLRTALKGVYFDE